MSEVNASINAESSNKLDDEEFEQEDEQLQLLRRAFRVFDTRKTGKIEREKVRLILNTLEYTYDDGELDEMLSLEDTEGKGTLTFVAFCRVAEHFAEQDDEVLQKELKEAFRLYDKEGNGFIPTSSLREILAALDDQLTTDQLNEMIAEIDTDESGTVDFEEFQEFMTMEHDREYYEQVDGEKVDIYDCPVLSAAIQKSAQNINKENNKNNKHGGKGKRRLKMISHPTNQNG